VWFITHYTLQLCHWEADRAVAIWHLHMVVLELSCLLACWGVMVTLPLCRATCKPQEMQSLTDRHGPLEGKTVGGMRWAACCASAGRMLCFAFVTEDQT
jgi:hypothetical protein